jgi:hypothetical protein
MHAKHEISTREEYNALLLSYDKGMAQHAPPYYPYKREKRLSERKGNDLSGGKCSV